MPTTRKQATAPQQFEEMQHGDVTLRALPRWPGYWGGTDGHVWSTKRGTPHRLAEHPNKKTRMMQVTLYRADRRYERTLANGTVRSCVLAEARPVHLLIASVWLPPKPAPGYTVDHRDEDRRNNRPDNLRWLTLMENIQAYHANHPDLETFPSPGEMNPSAKLTEVDVRRLLALRGKLPATVVAPIFGVCPENVRKIWRGDGWKHLQGAGQS